MEGEYGTSKQSSAIESVSRRKTVTKERNSFRETASTWEKEKRA
jgi:hypothetical protein